MQKKILLQQYWNKKKKIPNVNKHPNWTPVFPVFTYICKTHDTALFLYNSHTYNSDFRCNKKSQKKQPTDGIHDMRGKTRIFAKLVAAEHGCFRKNVFFIAVFDLEHDTFLYFFRAFVYPSFLNTCVYRIMWNGKNQHLCAKNTRPILRVSVSPPCFTSRVKNWKNAKNNNK